jgi:hypothetical protein
MNSVAVPKSRGSALFCSAACPSVQVKYVKGASGAILLYFSPIQGVVGRKTKEGQSHLSTEHHGREVIIH